MKPVPYTDGDLALKGVLYEPKGSPLGGVLVVPTIAGPNPPIWRRGQMLADAGYLAFVCDIYGRGYHTFSGPGEIHACADALRADPRAYRDRFLAAMKAFSALEQAKGLPMAAIGYCMGGQAVLELARDGADLRAVVSFHGLLTTDLPASKRPKARILVCHGQLDPLVPPEQVAAFQREMSDVDTDWHLHIYAKAKHGFTDPGSDARGIAAVAYDESADKQSWAAMLSFLGEALT